MSGRSAASRQAQENAARLAALRPTKRTKLGTCPVCVESIYDNQDTSWCMLGGEMVRVHGDCRYTQAVATKGPQTER